MVFNLLNYKQRLSFFFVNKCNKSVEYIPQINEIINIDVILVPKNPCDKYIEDFYECINTNNCNYNCNKYIINYINCKIKELVEKK